MKYLEHIGIFSYDEIINILKHQKHGDYNYITEWFGEYDDDELDAGNICWGDGNDLLPDEYWIVDYKTETAMTLRTSNLNNLIEELKDFFKYIHTKIIDITEDVD